MNKQKMNSSLERVDSDLQEESNSNLFLARHITLDYYDCDSDVIFDPKVLEQTLLCAAEAIGATIISSHFNNFEPQGVSGVVVLAESHLTIHTWPEYGYAAIDMFTCGNMEMEKGIELMTKAFNSNRVELVTDLKRGLATNFPGELLDNNSKLREGGLTNNIEGNSKTISTGESNNWEKDFNESGAWGIASSVDVFGCNPILIRDSGAIKEYVSELCNLIQMKTFGNTEIVHFGEDEKVAGYSMIQLIETSLISGHFANATNAAYLDIFSCKYYDPGTVADFTVRYFKGKYYKLNINYRDDK